MNRTTDTSGISVIVPTLNEADNLQPLLSRIDATLQNIAVPYEVIIIDDYSSDGTPEVARHLSATYPVQVSMKQGERGKAFSLLQGFDEARYDLIAMIDADLQYAPEELAPMYQLLADNNADVIITDRKERKSSWLRKRMTKIYNFMFAQLLFGIHFDTQSGLKLFKRSVLNGMTLDPSPWTFDLEFLVRALESRRKILSHTIEFNERNAGVTKVKVLSSSMEMASASLRLRLRTSVRKLRAGKQANTRFLKRAMTASLFAVVLSASLLSFGNHPTSALSLNRTNASILTPIYNLLHPSQPTNTSGGSTNTLAKSSASNANAQPTSTTTTAATSNGTPASTSTTQSTSTTAPASQKTTSTSKASAEPASVNSQRTAATGTSNAPDQIYNSGYPYYKLSSGTTHTLNRTAYWSFVTGLGILTIAIVIFGTRALIHTVQPTRKYSHS